MTVPRWERYKHFFQITIFRYLVLWFSVVPVIVTLLEGIDRPLLLTVGDTVIHLDLGLPFSWQLLWLSSLFFLIALVIYHVRCPAFIKRYNQYTEYKSYSHDPRWLAWEARDIVTDPTLLPKFFERLSTKSFIQKLPDDFSWNARINPVVEEKVTRLFFSYSGSKYALAMPLLDGQGNEVPGAERGIFWEIFGRFSSSRLPARGVILALLILSGILFSIVLIEHIWFGVTQVWEWGRAYVPVQG